jgi:lipid II:glycine glycyltransferase (peptidoglycan interpeptide bridge formation enzyme)
MEGIRVDLVGGTEDPAWDAYVTAAPGGSHVQSALWAAVKARIGWSATRVVARRGGLIVGGAQILLRDVGPARLAYAPRAPLCAADDPGVLAAVLEGMIEVAQRRRLTYLKVQPPAGRSDILETLRGRGFVASDLEAAPVASAVVDLAFDSEILLARMRSGTRANIRKAQRRGVTVRVGSADDFPVFQRLVAATSQRQGFDPYPAQYFRGMWEAFATAADAVLLIAEYQDAPVTSLLVVGFNDTASFKMGGWRGDRAVRPNELAHFRAMCWARERGYRFYDFEGFEPDVERAFARGVPSEASRRGVAWFKQGFGGDVLIFPEAMDYSPSRILRPAVRLAAPRLTGARRVAFRLLGRR